MDVYCPKCKKDYDLQVIFPRLLDCNHCFCEPCLTDLYRQESKLICLICKKVTQKLPKSCQDSKEVIQNLQEQEQSQATIEQGKNEIRDCRKQMLQTVKDINKAQANIWLNLFQQFKKYNLFKIQETEKQLEETLNQIDQKLDYLERDKRLAKTGLKNVNKTLDISRYYLMNENGGQQIQKLEKR